MSTLPRTRSLSGADTSSLKRNFRLEKHRPASLCEASWNKVDPEDRLRRTPSQANNLCTTVPTSIVNRTLGGRHTPTRNSLRHSRMAVMARNAKAGPAHRWTNRNSVFGRVSFIVIWAYILVGVMACLLALWLLQWAPSLSFKEVPHYSGGTIVMGGVWALALVYGLPRHKKRIAQILKILLFVLLLASLLSCASVCVFDTLHLVNLAPMECRMRSDVIIQPASQDVEGPQPPEEEFDQGSSAPSRVMERLRRPGQEEEEEGSGTHPTDLVVGDDEEGFPVDEDLEVKTTPLSSFEAQINDNIYVNVSICVCYRRKDGWRIVLEYPKLSCHEVKNILPIFLVASCVVMVVGGVLSSVLMYLLWASRKRLYGPYGSTKPSEVKPFIFKSSFKNSRTKPLNNSTPSNGNHLYR